MSGKSGDKTLQQRERDAEQIGNNDPKGTVRLTSGAKRDLDEFGSTEAHCVMDGQKFVVKVVLDE